jgi:RNA polymerase sigma-70 factor (ECF subfamily)
MHDELDRSHEAILVAAVLAGDPRAWQVLYDSAWDRLERYAVWRAGGLRELAEDLLQETWLLAVRKIHQFDPARGSFAAWVVGLASNVARNLLRQRRYRQRQLVPIKSDLAAEADRAEAEIDGEAVARALAQLPARYERILRAKYLDGLTVQQIAQQHGETVAAVESALTRARQAFRETYSPTE